MWGLELAEDAAAVHEAAIRHGLLVNRTAGKVIRLLPPLTITEAELDRALVRLDAAFSEVLGAPSVAAALGSPLAGATT